jgi:hypothetical protein
MEDPAFVGHFGTGNAWISANGEFSVWKCVAGKPRQLWVASKSCIIYSDTSI